MKLEEIIKLLEGELVHSHDCLKGSRCNCGIKKAATKIYKKLKENPKWQTVNQMM